DRVIGTLRLADVAVDALVGDHQRHGIAFYVPRARPAGALDSFVPNLAASRAATLGATKLLTSPPKRAISRTIVEDMKRYCSEGVRNKVSTSGYRFRFIPAIWNSYSKSDTARRPRRITRASTECTKSISSEENPMTLTFRNVASTSRAIAM